MTLYLWSQTADTNAAIDPSINFRENQSPSTYNNSARAMMAAAAKFRDDASGKIETGGGATAYTVTSNQVLTEFVDGFLIAFSPHATSGAAPTLAVDGLDAKPLRGWTGKDLPAGALVLGTPYVARYSTSSEEWLLQGFFEPPGGVPIGGSVDYWGSTAPNSSWLFMAGQAISRTTYATLFARLSTSYGAGNGSTTFNIPDARGRVSAGLDNMGGSAAGRLSGFTSLNSSGGASSITLSTAQIPSHVHANSLIDPGHFHTASASASLYTSAGGFSVLGSGSNVVGLGATISISSALSNIAITNALAGGGGSHDNVQPTIGVNKMIRAL